MSDPIVVDWNTNMEAETRKKLFDAVMGYVKEAGGDGDGWIISPEYIRLADLFERTCPGWNRFDMDDRVYFGCGDQSSIAFLPDESLLPSYAGDIIVKVFD